MGPGSAGARFSMRHGHGMMRRLEDEKPPDLDYFKLIRIISPLLWPEELNLKARVFLCAATLIVARFANIMVIFKSLVLFTVHSLIF